MAMIAPMKIVPQNSGTEPNAPDEPAWSARIAVCGLHSVPNRKSTGGTKSKKRRLSNISDSRMPSVVRIAISEAASSSTISQRSTPRAGAELRRGLAQREPALRASATASATAPPIRRIAGLGVADARARARVDSGLKPCSRWPWAISRASARIESRCIAKSGRARPSGVASTAWSTSRGWIGAHTAISSSAGIAAHKAA